MGRRKKCQVASSSQNRLLAIFKTLSVLKRAPIPKPKVLKKKRRYVNNDLIKFYMNFEGILVKQTTFIYNFRFT